MYIIVTVILYYYGGKGEMAKKRYVILGIVFVASVLMVGCKSGSEQTSDVKNEVTAERITEIETSKEESETSDNISNNIVESGVVGRVSDNPNIKTIEDDPHFEGAGKTIDGFLSDLVNDRLEDAKSKCLDGSDGYKDIQEILKSVDDWLDKFASIITSYDEKKDMFNGGIKSVKNNIKSNKHLKEFAHNYIIGIKLDEPVITDVTEISRRSLLYKIEIGEFYGSDSKMLEDILINSGNFEDIIKSDFYKDYYVKNSKAVDKLYDKYNSERDGKNAVLVKFLNDEGKAFFNKVSEEIEEDSTYVRVVMNIRLKKEVNNGKTEWLVESIDTDYSKLLEDYPELFLEDSNDEFNSNNAALDYEEGYEYNGEEGYEYNSEEGYEYNSEETGDEVYTNE